MIRDFIANNPDWLARLENEYRILVSRDGDLVSLKYNQLESPMNYQLVQECRGLVVHVPTGQILAHPYNKFWNYGEELAATIDWPTARVLEKLDGSLMILYWNPFLDRWAVASSGNPVAGGGFGMAGDSTTFAEAFWRTWKALGYALPGHKNICFLFEFCAKENRIVVRHDQPRIVLHGARNVRHGDEMTLDELAPIAASCGWEIVKSYPLGTIESCLAAAEALDPLQNEGFVVVDADFRRVKIKSPRYVVLHHIRGEGMSLGRAVDLWVSGETQELLTHFPEFEPDIAPIHARLDAAAMRAFADFVEFRHLPSRKEFALAVKDRPWSSLTFRLHTMGDPTIAKARELLREQTKGSLMRLAGKAA